jgi:hypothetical protein
MNCVITGITYNERFAIILGDGSKLRTISILVAVEHIVIMIKFIIAEIIDDVPAWV